MIRISRMADYAVIASTYIARYKDASHSAAGVAEATGVPLPSASKILKQLCKAGILLSKRGSKGGYYLAKDPKIISVATLITAVDGPIAITDCLDEQRGCDLENICIVKAPWQLVSDSIEDALKGLSLADIVHSMVTEGPFAIPQTNETHTL